jgi:hypothetical protein
VPATGQKNSKAVWRNPDGFFIFTLQANRFFCISKFAKMRFLSDIRGLGKSKPMNKLPVLFWTCIVIQKREDKWQIAVDSATSASLKVG